MSNEYFPVFLYRWDDANEKHGASRVGFGEQRKVVQHYPSVVIGVATRPIGDPIEHHECIPDYQEQTFEEFRDHVHEVADDVRWFDECLKCDPDVVMDR